MQAGIGKSLGGLRTGNGRAHDRGHTRRPRTRRADFGIPRPKIITVTPRTAFDRRKAEIAAMTDLDAAYDAAQQLALDTAIFRSEAATLRSETAARMRAARGMSIRQLGERIGVRKPTAQSLLDRTRKP